MLRLVEVAAGDVREVLERSHREQVVAIGRLPQIDEIGQLVAVAPEIAGADLEAPHGPMVRMAGDAERALPADRAQDILRLLVGGDVLPDVERDDVRVLPSGPRDDCRPVSRACTSPFLGSSITVTPGTDAATSRVASVLALLMTRISSGARNCRRRE